MGNFSSILNWFELGLCLPLSYLYTLFKAAGNSANQEGILSVENYSEKRKVCVPCDLKAEEKVLAAT